MNEEIRPYWLAIFSDLMTDIAIAQSVHDDQAQAVSRELERAVENILSLQSASQLEFALSVLSADEEISTAEEEALRAELSRRKRHSH